jgi:hypothetical protein
MKKLFSITASILFIVSCGGGGGGTTPTPTNPIPTVNLSADPVSVLLGSTSTLTWSSNNATSCSASWTNQTGSSGSEAVTISTAGNNSFSITCTGAGGSRSASVTVEGYRNTDGVVVDGYISGAEVCIDVDQSWTCDSSESSTTSDNNGKFTIKYANGNLVSIGGTDLDSQTLLDNLLITHKLTGHSDFKAVTPVTSVGAFMTDASLVNAALGIDSSIDVSTFDPVANKGDGGINDYLYEKGNQLTVLAYALQNITNDLNTTTETTQDYFKAITEEIEKEYTETETRVDIETEEFITKTLDNIVEAKTVTITNEAKANTTKALSGVMPVIEVKSSDDLTTSVIRFAVSTLQTDIQAIANGTASAEIVASYSSDVLTYIAEDQSIEANEITPDIIAIADSATTLEDTSVTINVVLNDSYLTSAPITVSAGNASNGTTTLAESSPEQIVYTPNADYNGTDIFSYTITQGDKTSSTDVTVTIEAVNDAPSINIASTIQVTENQTAVTTVSVSDVDEDELTLTLGGTNADSFNLSDENVLTFKEAPDYETKTSYPITLSLTDGTETVTKDVTIAITNVNDSFSGEVIDGYISGAEIFIDQNFNFVKDSAEYSTTTNSDGSFLINIDDTSLFECLKNRPIVADVPLGAVDSTLGEVTNAYQMVLPSISDTGNSSIVVSPFTSLLGDAVIQGKNSSGIVEDIAVSASCEENAKTIASSITSELLQVKNTIESSLDISFDDLLIDFIENNNNSIVNETNAQNIAAFFPYFKELSDEFDTELSNIHNKSINTNITIKKDSINSILSDSEISEIPLSFIAIYETEPSDSGWFIQEKINAYGASITKSGEMKHFTCFTNAENCSTTNRNLAALRNASERYTRTSTFLNNNYNPTSYNYQLVIEDEQRVDFDINGNPQDRVCIYQNWLYLVPVNSKENFTTNDRYNTGASDGSNSVDDCVSVLENKDEALFVALVDSYNDGTYFEEIDIRITNPRYSESTFFENKVNNIYQNRDTLDLDPLIQEIASIPRTFNEISTLRSKLSSSSTDQVSIYWTKRDANGNQLESARIDIKNDPANDVFNYGTYENSDSGSEYTLVSSSEGQQAKFELMDRINTNSDVFNNTSYIDYNLFFVSSSSIEVEENQTSVTTVSVSGARSGSISFSLSGTDASSFNINSSGLLVFKESPDYETKNSYSLTVVASDDESSVSQEISISVTNVNEVPQISALSSILSPDENQTNVVTVTASDPDENTTLTYSVSGTDSSLFSISSSGVLTFKAAPDYETPGDADADNNYQINVIVSDGSLSVTQAITIQVQNVADLISGVAVDGYVAGATVFQDLNNDGDLDSGEPSAATNSLGSFSLNLSSVNINAPVRIYNGFDLASNEIHPSIMDISVSETGSYIVTPISTLVGRLKIEDTSLSAMVPQSMIAGALGISLADSPNDSILGFDPIAYFNGSDTTLASEARPVFAASQLLMTMGGGNYSVHKFITDQVLSSLSSTLTTAAGSSITLSSANDILGLKQDAYDAIFNGYVDTTLANNPPINSIQFRNNKAVMTDYLNGSSSSAVNYSLYGVHDGTTTLVADLVGAKLDYDNLKQILDSNGTGTPMDLNFELANIPPAGSGSTGVTLKLLYGDDTTQDADEDYLQITLTANWESDGTNFKIKLPANSAITASFYDRGGTILSITPTNQAEDIFTVTKDGPNRPATLSLRLSKLFNAFPTEVTGLSSFLDGAAEFTYLVEFDNFTIYDHLDNTFTKIQGTFEVDANPGITVFADDIYVHENATSKDISFYLSQAASSDVTLDYAIADASTASSSDYTLSSGTVTIPAGSMSATLTIPVTNDTIVEAQEEIRLTLSNVQNAVLGRTSVSAFITDGEEILANSTQKAILADNIFKDSKASINAYIKNKLDTTTITISGTSYTYSQVLINNSVTTDVYAYLDSIIDDYEVLSETLISTIMTKADAYIDAQLSSFADYTAFATALTQLNSGIKGLNISQIVGTNINTNGTFPSGQNATTLQTALDGKVDTLVTLSC